jgi:hypothetical protein
MSDERPAGDRRAAIPTGLRPLGGLADLAELFGGESARSRKFLGGLVIGALVGAAVAGGSLVRRRTGGGGATGR